MSFHLTETHAAFKYLGICSLSQESDEVRTHLYYPNPQPPCSFGPYMRCGLNFQFRCLILVHVCYSFRVIEPNSCCVSMSDYGPVNFAFPVVFRGPCASILIILEAVEVHRLLASIFLVKYQVVVVCNPRTVFPTLSAKWRPSSVLREIRLTSSSVELS